VEAAGSSPDEVSFSNLLNPSYLTMVQGFTQHLSEMMTRNLHRGKERPARKADNLATIYELIV
jgi:hypothetical protein